MVYSGRYAQPGYIAMLKGGALSTREFFAIVCSNVEEGFNENRFLLSAKKL